MIRLWGAVISLSEKLREAETWYSLYGLVLDYKQGWISHTDHHEHEDEEQVQNY